MANEEHLAILKKGVRDWNAWRRQNPEIRPCLSEAPLAKASLLEADLHGAELVTADLSEADLLSATLSGADLSGAGLFGAVLELAEVSDGILREADLRGAVLIGSALTRSVLVGAKLRGARLEGVDVRGADFTSSVMGYTVFDNVDLSDAKGLEGVKHEAPSTIGVSAVYRSKGKIPEVFLRGAGVPESFITYMKSLVVEPIEFYSCFISYSSKDHEFAERLHADLQSKNVRCWFAPEDMKIGDRIRPRIDEAIRVHDKLLLVLTESSMKSAWVEKEVETAFEKERKQGRTVLFPIRLDDAVMDAEEAWAADIRRTRHIGDFRGWKRHEEYKKAFERLMRDLKAG